MATSACSLLPVQVVQMRPAFECNREPQHASDWGDNASVEVLAMIMLDLLNLQLLSYLWLWLWLLLLLCC